MHLAMSIDGWTGVDEQSGFAVMDVAERLNDFRAILAANTDTHRY